MQAHARERTAVRRMGGWLGVVLWALGGTVHAADDAGGTLESFALARDRAAVVARLVPGAADHAYFSALLALHENRLDDAGAILRRWTEARAPHTWPARSFDMERIRHRLAIMRYAADPVAGWAGLRALWPDAAAPAPDADADAPPSAMPPDFPDAAAWRARIFAEYHDARFTSGIAPRSPGGVIAQFEPLGVDALDFTTPPVEDAVLDAFFDALQRADAPGLPALRARRFAVNPETGGLAPTPFGRAKVDALFTLARLEELGRLAPALKNESAWVDAVLARMTPGTDAPSSADPTVDDDAGRAAWEARWAFAQTLPPAFHGRRHALLLDRLKRDRARGVYDAALFDAYLDTPRKGAWVSPDWLAKTLDARGLAHGDLSESPDEDALVHDTLAHRFAAGASWTEFADRLNDEMLRRLYAETRLLAGVGDAEEAASMLDADALRTLAARVDLDFAPDNPARWRDGEPVTLRVAVKNVPALTVRVFTVNTLNWYRDRREPVPTDLDLDGLVSTATRAFAYDDPPMRRVSRAFDFPEINAPGVYIVEFVGGGRAARAVVRRGALRLRERVTAAGHALRVLDDADRPVPGAAVWIGDRRHTAPDDRPDEEIVVPFGSKEEIVGVILEAPQAGDMPFADLGLFQTYGEEYRLRAAFHVERESLWTSNPPRPAKLVIRPSLTINNAPAPVALLTDPVLRIEATDRFGRATVRTTRNVALRDDAETVHEFAVPENLAELRVALSGRVRNLGRQRDDDLSAERRFAVNGLDQTGRVEAMHFARVAGDDGRARHVIDVRGKTGEPRPGRRMRLYFKHREFKTPHMRVLKTDARGRVDLGPLDGITTVLARFDDAPAGDPPPALWAPDASAGQAYAHGYYRFEPPRARVARPLFLHAARGETVRVALEADTGPDGTQPDRRVAALVEWRDAPNARTPVPVRDASAALTVRDGALDIAGLDPGDYRLRVAGHDGYQNMTVRVADVPANGRLLSAARAAPLRIAEARVDGDFVVARVAGGSPRARVHVFASRYVADWTAAPLLPPPYDATTVLPRFAPVSQYLSARDIGDVARYILDRRATPPLAGNPLPRPGLLANPWALRPVPTTRREARAGEAVERRALPPTPAAEADRSAMVLIQPVSHGGSAHGWIAPQDAMAYPDNWLAIKARAEASVRALNGQPSGASLDANLDWRPMPAVVLANLTPDADGTLRLPRAGFGANTFITIVALDNDAAAMRPLSLPAVDETPRDLRLADALDPARTMVRRKIALSRADPAFAAALERAYAEDGRTLGFAEYGDVPALYRLLRSWAPDEATFAEFEFLARWPSLTEDEKQTLCERYASHELHFFLYRKDAEFFARAIRPVLAEKRVRTFMDAYLLGEDLTPWSAGDAYRRLNTAERLLLADRMPDAMDGIHRAVANAAALAPFDRARADRALDIALRGDALDWPSAAAAGMGPSPEGPAPRARAPEYLREVPYVPGQPMPENAGPGEAWCLFQYPAVTATENGRTVVKEPARVTWRLQSATPPLERETASQGRATPGIDFLPARRAETRYDETPPPFDETDGLDVIRARAEVRRHYRAVEDAREWIESDYYRRDARAASADFVRPNGFWADYAARPGGDAPFASPRMMECAGDFTAMVFALALADVPWTNATASTTVAPDPGGRRQPVRVETVTVRMPTRGLVFLDALEAAAPPAAPSPLLVNQHYFRPDDRYEADESGGIRREKFVTGEFVTHTVYGALVAVTNPTGAPVRATLLTQLPEGALPVANAEPLAAHALSLDAYRTRTVEYHFYFPRPGVARHFPAHLAVDDALAAVAAAAALPVVDAPTVEDRASWAFVSQRGSNDDVLAFLRDRPLGRVGLSAIDGRMADPAFFGAAVATLRARRVYDPTLWRHALRQDPAAPGFDATAVAEFIESDAHAMRRLAPAFASPVVDFDPVRRGAYAHLEYAPLVHERAHPMAGAPRIQTPAFAEQYRAFLDILAHTPDPDDELRLAAAYYLLLQDRRAEAMVQFDTVDRDRVAERTAYDYMAVWTALQAPDADRAALRARAARHAEHPSARWRKLFAGVVDYLDRQDGRAADAAVDPDSREQALDRLADAATTVTLDRDGDALVLRYRHADTATVRYYRMDPEALFNRAPFTRDFARRFAYVAPNHTETVALPADGVFRWVPPAAFAREHALVEVVVGDVRRSVVRLAGALSAEAAENHAQLRAVRTDTGAPVPAAYVCVYARHDDGRVAFHKDGYTDALGRFDYATTSAPGLDTVTRFALLVLAPDVGAALLEAAPPTH